MQLVFFTNFGDFFVYFASSNFPRRYGETLSVTFGDSSPKEGAKELRTQLLHSA